MVSVRLVDLPDSPEEEEVPPIPEMIFSSGEEPVGVRVLTYLSSGAILRIYNALDEEEVQIIRKSAFGKILEIIDKPVFSGRFVRYLLSRQLRTNKRHETWFRFSGKPIRFSLREFAIVTGLPCGKFPTKSKMKLKDTIAEKPYWPSLFGKIEVATVSSVIKMLRKRTVEDRVVRIKYACLVILASVLLPTNLKMKICREHVEAIEDLDEFFAYPWGRLAFDMLMCSIKERDEVALSQNTIAVKGFALALQLVMVEAVPCLNEVIQETCSSSEGDSEEEGDEKASKPKRKTLSPAHARNIDKRADVLVKSMIDDDPLRPIDESELVWSDEEEDEKVNNLICLINTNYGFTNSNFKGGLTRVDVERMRTSETGSSKLKKPKKHQSFTSANDPGYIASLAIDKIKPEFQTMEGSILDVCKRVDCIEGSVLGLVQSVFPKFKEEMLQSVKKLVVQLSKGDEVGPSSIPEKETESLLLRIEKNTGEGSNAKNASNVNDETINNILGNISAYSTPPGSPRISLGENLAPSKGKEVVDTDGGDDDGNQSFAQSAQSQNHHMSLDAIETMDGGNRNYLALTEMPSFSLGLTQEEPTLAVSGRSMNAGEDTEDPQQSRKSKRLKCVPQALLDDYHCSREIVSRSRKSQRFIFAFDGKHDISLKYAKLLEQLNQQRGHSTSFKLGGLTVTGKDIILIAERTKLLTGKVVDLLIRLAKRSIEQHFHAEFAARNVYLDSKYVCSILRSYPRFCKRRKKSAFRFPKGLVNLFCDKHESHEKRRRYYFTLNVCKKHWVGVCVDYTSCKVIVLDCNNGIFSDPVMEKQLYPHLVMVPYLVRLAGLDFGTDEPNPYAFERPKCVSQNANPCDSGLMAVLLIATHAVYGIEACKYINSDILVEEGKSAAIMAMEF